MLGLLMRSEFEVFCCQGLMILQQLVANLHRNCARQLTPILCRQLKDYDIRTALDLIGKGCKLWTVLRFSVR
jgi:hypothetical protein